MSWQEIFVLPIRRGCTMHTRLVASIGDSSVCKGFQSHEAILLNTRPKASRWHVNNEARVGIVV